jgi:hypothetical protein
VRLRCTIHLVIMYNARRSTRRRGAPRRWTVAEARRRFAELLRSAAKEPQTVYRRDELIAAVVDATSFGEFAAWRAAQRARTLGQELADLRRICIDDDYELELPERTDRPVAGVDEPIE